MTWWLIGILGYLVALGVVLILAGGVRRSDESHGSAQRDLESANRDLDAREGRLRPAAPPRTAAHLQEVRRAAGS